MNQGVHAAVALPPYIQHLSIPGGEWKRACLYALLRLSSRRRSFLDADIGALRAEQSRWDLRFGRVDPRVGRTPVVGAGFAGEWIDVPESRPDRIILYLHGGAFVFRWPGVHTAMVARWCARLKARALMVDYRLAPEHPFPAAPDDCHAAYRWLIGGQHDPRSVVLCGDSAGGNLTLVTLQRIRGAGEPIPACGVLLSAGVDFTLSSPSLFENGGRDPMLDVVELMTLRTLYAAPERFVDPGVSPLFGSFAGLPPLLFQVGSLEMLLDESRRAAARAHAAGVAVEVEIWERMWHVFQALPLPQADAALERIAGFIARHAGWAA
jgi:acetyl esterase/lipase